jgi:hypothetical protein
MSSGMFNETGGSIYKSEKTNKKYSTNNFELIRFIAVLQGLRKINRDRI